MQKLNTIFYSIIILLICTSSVLSQNGIKLNTPEAYKGYTLCNQGNRAYLLDNCGRISNTWTNVIPRIYARLTNEGNLLYIDEPTNRIIEKDWDNNIIVSLPVNATNLFLNYEILKLENGNYLSVARRVENSSYFANLGWNSSIGNPFQIDVIVEVNPSGDIVWEWNIGDHTIQDQNSNVSNFGVIADHPELVDIFTISTYDWTQPESFMINSFDYNPDLDQILISVRKVGEFMIIDHSTTTEEAKGSTGGIYGKGGDILYRWGNPQNYGQGSASDQVLYFQHNPNWVKYGEHQGKIIVYNNGLTNFTPQFGDMSSVHIVNPPIDNAGGYILQSGQAFEPAIADLTIDEENTGTVFFSDYTSGAQVLPNGNIYITVGRNADFLEVRPDGTIVWEYRLPFAQYIFRTEKYDPDFPGFEGRDLSANGTVEFPSSNYNCELYTSIHEVDGEVPFIFQFDQSNGILEIQKIESQNNFLEVRNVQGQIISTSKNISVNTQVDLSHIPLGIYYVTIFDLDNNEKASSRIVRY